MGTTREAFPSEEDEEDRGRLDVGHLFLLPPDWGRPCFLIDDVRGLYVIYFFTIHSRRRIHTQQRRLFTLFALFANSRRPIDGFSDGRGR